MMIEKSKKEIKNINKIQKLSKNALKVVNIRAKIKNNCK